MECDELFENQSLTASKLKAILREHGFTKASLCKRTDMSASTIDMILNAECNDKNTFDEYFQKILAGLKITVIEFLLYEDRFKEDAEDNSSAVFTEYQRNERAKKQYNLLLDILELCSIYY